MIPQDRVTLSDRELEIIAESVERRSQQLRPGDELEEYELLLGRIRCEQVVRSQLAAHADDMQQSGG